MICPSRLEIDLTQLDANLSAVRRLVGPGVAVCGVVKADAYGLGIQPIAGRLRRCGINMLAVYSLEQAEALVEHVTDVAVLVLMPICQFKRDGSLGRAAASGLLHLSIHSQAQIGQVDRIGRSCAVQLPVHLYVDTGMCRGGLSPDQLEPAIGSILDSKHLRLAGLYTHFAAADDDVSFTEQQLARFDRVLKSCPLAHAAGVNTHVANTFATYRERRYHKSMVRVGLGLYGYGPQLIRGRNLSTGETAVRPVLRWLSRIVHVGSYAMGSTVGYNRTHRLTRTSRLAVVPVGYGDGYPLALGNRAQVGVAADDGTYVPAPVVGKVNMDQIVIDLTDTPAAGRTGADVELIGNDNESPYGLPRLAELAGSSCYEMLCGLSGRLRRQYVEPSRLGVRS